MPAKGSKPAASAAREAARGAAREAAPPAAPKPFPPGGPLLGQDAAVGLLTRALGRGRMHHAWIFHGPTGVGKFTAAMRLARILLDPEATPAAIKRFEPPAPAESEVARLIEAGTHPDMRVIRKELAAVSDNRELRERKQTNIPLDLLRERLLGGVDSQGTQHSAAAFRTAVLGHGKVFIIDEAELLEAEAQNAMLKTLEEPPPRTWIILCTSHLERLLPTVRSRCQQVPFGTLSDSSMEAWWSRSALAPAKDVKAWINEFAAGSPGMAALAVTEDLHAWHTALAPELEALLKGAPTPALGEKMAELVDSFAQSVVKENEHASKEAANRLGAKLLGAILGGFLRRRMRESFSKGEAATEAWLSLSDHLRDMDAEIRANLNQKHVFANLAAQWSARLEEARAAISGNTHRALAKS